MQYDSISGGRSACEWSRKCSLPAALTSATKAFATGQRNSVENSPTALVGARRACAKANEVKMGRKPKLIAHQRGNVGDDVLLVSRFAAVSSMLRHLSRAHLLHMKSAMLLSGLPSRFRGAPPSVC